MDNKIKIYLDLLEKWNNAVPLTARGGDGSAINVGVEEALYLGSLIQEKGSLCDIGSGNGLPGVPLSFFDRWDVTLLDRATKKCIFLETVSRETGANFKVVNDDLQNHQIKYNIITSKAVMPFSEVAEVGEKLIKPGGVGYFLSQRSGSQKQIPWKFDVFENKMLRTTKIYKVYY